MAEYVAQTYNDPDGTLHYVYYDPDTGSYRDVSMTDAYNVGSSFLPPPSTDYAAPPTPDQPPVDPGQPTYGGQTQPAIQNIPNEGSPVQADMMLDPATNEWVPIVYDPEGQPGTTTTDVSTVDDTSGTGGGGTSGSSGSGGYYDSSGYYHSGSGYSHGSSGGSSGYSSSGGSGGYSSGNSGLDNLMAMRQLQNNWIAQHTQPGSGTSSQKTASVPGGASAGAWGATSAPPVHGPSSGGGGSSHGGGGGQIGALESRIRSNILGKIGGMFGGSSSSGSYPSSNYHPVKPPPPFTPPDPQMHGFARPYDYLNAQQSIFSHPEWLIPRAVGRDASTISGEYGQLSALPMGPLAKLLADSRSRTPNNPEPFINKAGALYDKIANSPYWFNTDKMLNALLHPKSGTALGVDFGRGKPPLTPQQQYDKDIYGPHGYYDKQTPGKQQNSSYIDPLSIYQPPGATQQADEMKGYLSAINTMRYGSKYATAVNDWDQRMIDQWGRRNIRSKPGGGQSLPAYLRGRV